MPGASRAIAGASPAALSPWFAQAENLHDMTTRIASEPQVRLVASPGTWIEDEAVRQLHFCARLDGMRHVTGLPSLYTGKTYPVGAAFVTEEFIYPTLIGPDVGCGMGLFKTDLRPDKVSLNDWAETPFELEHPWHEDVSKMLAAAKLNPTEFDADLGMLGGAGHFAELQMVERIQDRVAASGMGIDAADLLLLVHTGSHRLGQSVFENYVEQHGTSGLATDSDEATDYLMQHDRAVRWAEASRRLVAQRFLEGLSAKGKRLLDTVHNRIACRRDAGGKVWVHRRGAVPAEGPVVIAGTRGTFSYLVQACPQRAEHTWSLAHGAGRKWSRTESRARMRERFQRAELEETGLGGRVVCADRGLLYEEAPGVYKNIETIMADLVGAGLVSVVATLRPVLTYKTRRSHRQW